MVEDKGADEHLGLVIYPWRYNSISLTYESILKSFLEMKLKDMLPMV